MTPLTRQDAVAVAVSSGAPEELELPVSTQSQPHSDGAASPHRSSYKKWLRAKVKKEAEHCEAAAGVLCRFYWMYVTTHIH